MSWEDAVRYLANAVQQCVMDNCIDEASVSEAMHKAETAFGVLDIDVDELRKLGWSY